MGLLFSATNATESFCAFVLFVVQQKVHIQGFLLIARTVVLFLKTSYYNRSRNDIVADMLEAAKGGRVKTQIMCNANLSHSQLKDYLNLIIEKGFLENMTVERNRQIMTLYKTTDKGLKFLESYQIIKTMLMI